MQGFTIYNMSTYGELVHLVLDEIKLASDDSFFQREHVIFLLDKYRSFILSKTYKDIKKEIPESNFQTICLDLEPVSSYEGDTCSGSGYLRSIQKIPNMLTISNPKVSTMDYFTGNLTYVNRERFKYVGSNKYLKNIIYSTIAPNEHLYLKSQNIQYSHLERAKITGVFEDSAKASELECPDEEGNTVCDLLDRSYPLEEALIPAVIELVVKELLGAAYRPKDDVNNANDDLSDLVAYLRRNVKSDLSKQIEGV